MGALRYSKGKDHALIVQWSNNTKSKENQIVKEKKLKSDNEDEILKPIDEGSMKKVKKKGITYKCYYCGNGFHPKKNFFKKNIDIIVRIIKPIVLPT